MHQAGQEEQQEEIFWSQRWIRGRGQRWKKVGLRPHKTAAYNDAVCYRQGGSPPHGSAFATAAVLDAHNALVDDDEKPTFNLHADFNGGFWWVASAKERTTPSIGCEITMLVHSSTTEDLVDDELITGLENRTKEYALLGVPQTIVTAGKNC